MDRRALCARALVGAALISLLLGLPAVAQARGYLFTDTWGTQGTGSGQFLRPKGIGVDADGFVYVVDFANCRISKFAPDGTLVNAWGSRGPGLDQFRSPSRLAMGPDGTVYVTDAGNARILRFASDGRLLNVWGHAGSGPGELRAPRGIAVGPGGNVYVTDEGNCRVQVFTATGRFLRAWGSPGTGPGHFLIAKDVAVGPGGRVYVVDARADLLQVFSPSGRYLMTWGRPGHEPGRFLGPRGAAVRDDGHVFVADAGNARVQEFTADGRFVRLWGCYGSLPGLFQGPRDVAFAPDGSLVVADTGNQRVERFALPASRDATPPVTRSSPGNGWHRTAVTVTLTAHDAGGVLATYVRGNHLEAFAIYDTPLTVSRQGVHHLQFLSLDTAGNQEAIRRRTVAIDWTPPFVRLTTPGPFTVSSGGTATLAFRLADNLSPRCTLRVIVEGAGGAVAGTVPLGRRAVSTSGAAYAAAYHCSLAPGRYTLRLMAKDLAGNTRGDSVVLIVR